MLTSKDEPIYRSLQILVISIPVLIFSFIAAQSNAKFLKDQDLIKTYENEENPAEETDINVSNSQNDYTEPKQRKFSEKYHKAKRRQRKFKQKTVKLFKIRGIQVFFYKVDRSGSVSHIIPIINLRISSAA